MGFENYSPELKEISGELGVSVYKENYSTSTGRTGKIELLGIHAGAGLLKINISISTPDVDLNDDYVKPSKSSEIFQEEYLIESDNTNLQEKY